MITVTIFNTKDKVQKKFIKETWKLAMKVLDRCVGKRGWWARVDYKDGDFEIFHYMSNGWSN
jgi:hypothetical protein